MFSGSVDVRLICRFDALSMDDFRCIAVLGRGHFGKVLSSVCLVIVCMVQGSSMWVCGSCGISLIHFPAR